MKAMFSEAYYRKFWDELIAPAPGEHYINLEKELADYVADYEKAFAVADIPEDVINRLVDAYRAKMAQMIADRATALCKKDMQTLLDIEAGRASWGFISKFQEVEHDREFRRRFEFNCLQLADFRKKYSLN